MLYSLLNNQLNFDVMKIMSKVAVSLSLLLVACVPQKKFDELQGNYDNCRKAKADCDSSWAVSEASLNSCYDLNSKLKLKVTELREDSMECFTAYEKLKKQNQENEKFSRMIIANNQFENEMLLKDLNSKNEKLKQKEAELSDKEANLMEAQNRNRDLNADLMRREARVQELEKILRTKDSAVLALKIKIQEALLGFSNKGLTVETRNGKVYVSMEEKLLFNSGSITVGQGGENALLVLAKALNQNSDVSILVEGHTDNVPMNANSTIKDNLDLSVMRATSITRILTTKGAVDPKRITSAGRGEYFPIDTANTPEARAKNRRTDIILTPRMDELLDILNSNN